MIFSSRKVNELYQRYCRQVLKILRSPSYDLTGEECREIWDEIWKEAMRRKRELRKLKSEEERQSWILAVVKRKLEERRKNYGRMWVTGKSDSYLFCCDRYE